MKYILEKYFEFKYIMRGYRHIGNIFDPIQINPNDVNHLINEKKFNSNVPIFGIKDGDWDLKAYPTSYSREFRLFMKYFEHGSNINEMPEYHSIIQSLEKGNSFGGLDSKNQTPMKYNKYIQYIDKIRSEIDSSGYKSQKELKSGIINRFFRPPILDEMQIFIGRNGELICNSGKHRLIIAKVLELDTIPARVSLRHEKWQRIREKFAKDGSLPAGVQQSHPDLHDLCRDNP